MGTYPEDYEINVSEIIRLWVAEGFLKPNGVQILKETAEDYLKDLIDRNLILVCGHRSNGKIRSCRVHDLLRELCLIIANKEKFFCVVKAHSIPRGIDRERRLIFHNATSRYANREVFEALQSSSLVRSLICKWVEVPVKCRLLRVLSKALKMCIEAEFQNVNLQYLEFLVKLNWGRFIPPSISLIWNLQTLIIGSGFQVVVAPLEIWKMRQLRHLKSSQIMLPDPPPSDEADESVVLGNLQTLRTVVNFRLSAEACKRIPSIKKLRIRYSKVWDGYEDHLYEDLQNLCRLHKLESLSIWCLNTISITDQLKNVFPTSLNKLYLGGCSLHWEDLSVIIGSLPQLEVLNLDHPFNAARKWSCVEGGFRRLKFFSIRSSNLKSWILDSASNHFPVLEKLVLIDLPDLNEIPSDIGEIPTLQCIHLVHCSESATISAMKIKGEQESYGNTACRFKLGCELKRLKG